MSAPDLLGATVLTPDLEPLQIQLTTASAKKQLAAVTALAEQGDAGITILWDYLQTQLDVEPTPVLGRIYQLIARQGPAAMHNQLQALLPDGIVPLESERAIDYQPLQTLLIQQDYEAADRLSMQKLCELAGPGAMQRKWLYFSEVDRLPNIDLKTLDTLWLIYSEGKFGFSVQRELWLGLGRNFTKLWDKIAWKQGNVWTRYPGEFIWDLSAPVGHLPLSNQLRGVRTFEAILNHPVWTT
ncbi:MAG: hypothetical protein F6J87_06950 [Spirulina sp. SIO3F2]|nr:hypothetical protein [Spirulina sp. SIO3F2]